MAESGFTLKELKQALREAAGADEGVDLDGEILDTGFEDLGYDSLALMETGTRIERTLGIKLEESALVDATTPRALLDLINRQLTVA